MRKRKMPPIVPATPDRTLDEIRAIVRSNKLAGDFEYMGLESSEIGTYNRFLMFGENDEGFPDPETWSRIVD